VPGKPSASALTVRPTVGTEALALPAHTLPRSELPLSKQSRLGVRILAAASLIGLAAYAAHSLLGLPGSGSDSFFEDFLFNALLFAGALLCLSRAWLSSAERGAWCSLGVAATSLGERSPSRDRTGRTPLAPASAASALGSLCVLGVSDSPAEALHQLRGRVVVAEM
jgi:hypothetical protein